jgi:glutaconate CoA-transferase subunit A
MTSPDKTRSLADAVNLIRNGDVVAIGGHANRRHPMALVREIVRQGKKRLHLVGWDNGIDMDMLIGAGAVSTVQTSRIEIEGLGAAQNDRRHAATGKIERIEHSAETAMARFRASAMGMPIMIGRLELAAGVSPMPAYLSRFDDPFTGETWLAVQAIVPDVAIVHAHTADRAGNVQLDADHDRDSAVDALIARSAKTTIVSVEQIVSEEAIRARPSNTLLAQDKVSCVVEAPFGAHPCSCDARYDRDDDQLARYHLASASAHEFEGWLKEYIGTPADHPAYLQRVGTRSLMAVSRRRSARG